MTDTIDLSVTKYYVVSRGSSNTKLNQLRLSQFIVPVFYSVAMLLVVYFVWNSQYRIRQGGDSPLYRNLREYPAWIRHGFDPIEVMELTEIPLDSAGEWMRFESAQLKTNDSPLPNLPKRSFLSPWGKKT
ncbi:MAG: hypothetical protein LBB81_09605 [Treponema sp.]|jgi:hypothetical protein|nr:hypothetical protein [Treponema sp.]